MGKAAAVRRAADVTKWDREADVIVIGFGAAGACSLYINIILWFTEKEYVYPTRGPLKYFTYYWGFFVYWGVLALVYSTARLSGLEL